MRRKSVKNLTDDSHTWAQTTWSQWISQITQNDVLPFNEWYLKSQVC